MRGSTFIIPAAICWICMVLRFCIMFKVFLIWWGSMTEDWTDWTPQRVLSDCCDMLRWCFLISHLGSQAGSPGLCHPISHPTSVGWSHSGSQWSLGYKNSHQVIPVFHNIQAYRSLGYKTQKTGAASLWNQYFFNIFRVFFLLQARFRGDVLVILGVQVLPCFCL